MKTILLPILAILLLASSCVTQRRCNAKFPPSIDSTVSRDSSVTTRETITEREVPVFIYGETLKVDTVLKEGDVIFIEGDLVNLSAAVKNGRTHLECGTDSLIQLLATVRDTLRETEKLLNTRVTVTVTRTNTVVKKVKYIPAWFWIVLSGVAIYLVVRFKSNIFRIGGWLTELWKIFRR